MRQFNRANLRLSLLAAVIRLIFDIAIVAAGGDEPYAHIPMIGASWQGSYSGSSPRDRKRRRKRKREEMGLPDDDTLLDLATQYLAIQHKLWPQLANTEWLPPNTVEAAARLAEHWKTRYLSRQLGGVALLRAKTVVAIAAVYLRFSSDKSEATSLVQQMRTTLERASTNQHFIPWAYVFADAAVSATTPNRHGYRLAKKALTDSDRNVTVLYVEEISRANRYSLESLRLGAMLIHRSKRLIGVNDGFDSINEMSKVILALFSALQEFYVDQLRQRVKRGRKEAFRRGRHVRAPSFGYKLIPELDADGNQLYRNNGKPRKLLVVDEEAAAIVALAYKLLLDDRWSLSAIAQHLNDIKAGGIAWDVGPVRKLLERELHVGILVDGKTVREFNPETEKYELKDQPRSLWRIGRASHLAIVSYRRWKAAKKRLAEIAAAYSFNSSGGPRRLDVHKTRLVRPTCKCGSPLYLGRSGVNASYTCFNGRTGKNGCTFKSYKCARIVETCIINYVLAEILNEERISELVTRANLYLQEEAAKPAPDLSEKEAQLKQAMKKLARWKRAIEEDEADDVKLIVENLRKYEKQVTEIRRELRNLESHVGATSVIDVALVMKMLSEIRALLTGSLGAKDSSEGSRDPSRVATIANAAALIEKITGKIVVELAPKGAGRRRDWIARFSVNLVPVMLEIATAAKLPTACTWDLLKARSWKFEIPCEVVIRKEQKHEQIAFDVAQKHAAGASLESLTRLFGASSEAIKAALQFAASHQGSAVGHAPSLNADASSGKRPNQTPPKYMKHAERVSYLRDVEKLSFPEICRRIAAEVGETISQPTARRAYDVMHPEAVQESADTGEPIARGKHCFLPVAKRQLLTELVGQGWRVTDVVQRVGCSVMTVYRERRRQLADQSGKSASGGDMKSTR